MKRPVIMCLGIWFLSAVGVWAQEPRLSDDTQACLECHTMVYPGSVEDWRKGRMARITPAEAIKKSQAIAADKMKDVMGGMGGLGGPGGKIQIP